MSNSPEAWPRELRRGNPNTKGKRGQAQEAVGGAETGNEERVRAGVRGGKWGLGSQGWARAMAGHRAGDGKGGRALNGGRAPSCGPRVVAVTKGNWGAGSQSGPGIRLPPPSRVSGQRSAEARRRPKSALRARARVVAMAPPLAALLVLLLGPLRALAAPAFLRAPSASPASYVTQQPLWFSQRLDHFAPQDRRSFRQRYFHLQDFVRAPDAPVFLRICGEATCEGIPNDYLVVLAQHFGAALVCLEHRYYGESSPFAELTTANLQYLSSKQALFDLASFRHFYQVSPSPSPKRSLGRRFVHWDPELPMSWCEISIEVVTEPVVHSLIVCPCPTPGVGSGQPAVQQDSWSGQSMVCVWSIVPWGFECLVSVEISTSRSWKSVQLRSSSGDSQLH